MIAGTSLGYESSDMWLDFKPGRFDVHPLSLGRFCSPKLGAKSIAEIVVRKYRTMSESSI